METGEEELSGSHPRVLAINREIAESCIPRIQLATVSVLGVMNDKIIHDRTGVLYKVGDHHFVLTAAHNLREIVQRNIPLYISVNTVNVPLLPLVDARFLSTETEERDMAAIKISSDVASEITKYKQFVYHNQINLIPDPSRALLLFYGYPRAWAEHFVTETSMVSKGLAYFSHIDELDPSTVLDYNPQVHMLLQYSSNALHGVTGADESLPELEGISGCGVWQIGDKGVDHVRTRNAESLKLVGIQIGVYKKDNRVKATRLLHALRFIAENYPETRIAMSIQFPHFPSGKFF